MSTKKNGAVKAGNGTKAKFAEKATQAQRERIEFLQSMGKAISAAWAKLGDKANAMSVAKAIKADKVRLVDYCAVALKLRESKDKGLDAWIKADRALPVLSAACPAPKKAKA